MRTLHLFSCTKIIKMVFAEPVTYIQACMSFKSCGMESQLKTLILSLCYRQALACRCKICSYSYNLNIALSIIIAYNIGNIILILLTENTRIGAINFSIFKGISNLSTILKTTFPKKP